MPWFKVDDQLHSHPKARAAGLDAMGLWVLLGSYCGAYPTLRGRVTWDTILPHFATEKRPKAVAEPIVKRLVEAGLLVPDGDGFRFHDWDVYQPSPEELNAERQRKVDAGRRGGLAAAQARAAAAAQARAAAPATGSGGTPVPIPSRPLGSANQDPPSVGGSTTTPQRAPSAQRGTRLLPDWQPKPETLARFRDRERVDARDCIERFKNHWLASTGRNAIKLDWERTFVNWVLEDIARGRELPEARPRPAPEPTNGTNGKHTPLTKAERDAFLAELAERQQQAIPSLLRDVLDGDDP